MIRKKVRVAQGAEFSAVVREAANACVVLREDPKRRTFVVECEAEPDLDRLRDLGCRIDDDIRYSLDA